MLSRIVAGVVVLSLLSTAVSAVRGAMQERRERAEQSWNAARACVTAGIGASVPRHAELRQCSAAAHNAAELSQELPEHNGPQLEARAALDELAHALESGNEQQLPSLLDRATRAGRALGWHVVPLDSK